MELAKIRIMGPKSVVTATVERLGQVLDVSYDGNLSAMRRGEGVRAYLDVTDPGPADESPLAAAEGAKHNRDLGGEIGTLMAADRQLRAQPWYPIQPGDVVVWSLDMPDGGRHGQTLVAVEDPEWPTEGGAPLTKVSETPLPTSGRGDVLDGEDDVDEDLEDEWDDNDEEHEPVEPRSTQYQDFYDVWFEAGPSQIAVLRHGQLVHGRVHKEAR